MSVFLPPIPKIRPSRRTANAVCRPPVRPFVSDQLFPSSRLIQSIDSPPTASLERSIAPSAARNALVIGCVQYPPSGGSRVGNRTSLHVAPLSRDVCQRNGTPVKPAPPPK